MRELSLDQLQTFVEVVATGSFSAAAERIRLTQPAVSLQIKVLEQRLGVRLIERVGKRAQPTAAGRDLLVHVRRIQEAVAGAMAAISDHRIGSVGRICIGTGATACIYLLPPVLRQLRAELPALEIVVRTGNTREILQALEANTVDVGLVTLPAPGRMFDVLPVYDDEQVAIFPADGAPPARATAAALAELPLVLYEAGGNARRVIDDWFTRGDALAKPIMELGNVEAIKQLVGAGLGCAVLPRLAVTDGLANQRLLVRSLSPRLYRRIGLVLRRDKPQGHGLRAVVQALRGLKEPRRGR